MNKCKDCQHFKNDCGFSNVDEQLGLNGNFAACGQFVKSKAQMDFETCQHRKETDVMGVKKRSLFYDFDNIECDESNRKCRNQDKI